MKNLILIVCCVGMLGSCSKKNKPTTGTITGKVEQFDQYCGVQTDYLGNAVVSIDGTSYAARTDENGNYSIPDVIPGTYNLSFRREGYALNKVSQVVFTGNGTLVKNGSIFQRVSFTLSNARSEHNAEKNRVRLLYDVSKMPNLRQIVYTASKDPVVDLNDQASYDHVNFVTIKSNTTTGTFEENYPYPSGTSYYMNVFPSVINNFGYYDPERARNVFTNCGTPVTVKVTVP